MLTRRNLWGLAALLPALSLPKVVQATSVPGRGPRHPEFEQMIAQQMREACAYAKDEIEGMCNGPITYSNGRLNSWGSNHNEFYVGFNPYMTEPMEKTSLISTWKIHGTPLAAAMALTAFLQEKKGDNFDALEWRQTPEMSQYSMERRNEDNVIIGYDYHYRTYMRLTTVRSI